MHPPQKNYVQWENLPIALGASSFSGAATIMDDEKQTPVFTFACFGDDRKDWTAATKGGICQARPANLRDRHLVNWTVGAHDVDGTGLAHTDTGTGWRAPDGTWLLMAGNEMGPNEGAFRTWESVDFGQSTNFTLSSRDPFHTFHWSRCVTHPTLCGGSGWEPRDPEFYEVPNSDGIFVLKGSQKMCLGVGRDYIVLGTVDPQTQRFKPLYPRKRDMGSDLYNGGEFWASQTLLDTRGNRRILSAWVPESDCSGNTWPLKCETTLARGWSGVHSLPRTVEIEQFPEEPGLPPLATKTPPLRELDLLRINPNPASAVVDNAGPAAAADRRSFMLKPGSVHELAETGSSVEVRMIIDLPHDLPDRALWDVGVQLLVTTPFILCHTPLLCRTVSRMCGMLAMCCPELMMAIAHKQHLRVSCMCISISVCSAVVSGWIGVHQVWAAPCAHFARD